MKTLINSLVFLTSFMLAASTTQAQDDHSDHTLEVSRVLPASMIEGPHYRIVDPVVNYFALDQFIIESDYGTFEAYGQLMLRIRLREIMALGTMSQLSNTKITASAAASEGKKQFQAIGTVAAHPFKSAKGISSGIMKRFRKFSRDVKEDVQTARDKTLTRAEKKELYASRWLGVEKSWLKWADKLKIDPYTSNEVLRAELERVATADAKGALGGKIFIPTISGLGLIKDVHKLVTTFDLRELLEYNEKQLVGLGASKQDIEYFFSLPHYNPTSASIMIALISELTDVKNDLALFQQALTVESDIDALFLIESTLMAVWYDQERTPLDEMLLVTGIPAARTKDGRIVVFCAVDFPHWSDELAAIILELQHSYSDLSENRKLMLAGQSSRRFRDHVEDLDWLVETDIRPNYLPVFTWAASDEDLQVAE